MARGIDNPHKREDMLDAVEKLNQLVPTEISIAKEVAQKPEDESLRVKLQVVTLLKDQLKMLRMLIIKLEKLWLG